MQPINILGLWDQRFIGVLIPEDENLQKLFESGQHFMTSPVMNDEGKLTGITLLAIDKSSVQEVEYNEIHLDVLKSIEIKKESSNGPC